MQFFGELFLQRCGVCRARTVFVEVPESVLLRVALGKAPRRHLFEKLCVFEQCR